MIKFTILGEAASKANGRSVVKFGNRMAIIKSSKALAYEASALLQIPKVKPLEGDLRLTAHAYYASRRPDLDLSIVMDVMQLHNGKGIYKNDRQIKEHHFYHHLDKKNPRVEIEIEEIDWNEDNK